MPRSNIFGNMSTAENIAFMVIRGLIALAMVGLGFYCVAQGIHFFALPRVEAEQIRIHFIGLDITASELGAVIFAVGLAVCYLGQRTASMRMETTRGTPVWTPTRPEIPALPELTAFLDDLQRNATRLQPAKAKEGIGMSVAEGHMAIPAAALQLPSEHRTSESVTFVESTRKPSPIQALRNKVADEIRQIVSASTDAVLTVEEGVALFPGEGSQQACGYQPNSPTIAPCTLPLGHKPPHICRSKIKPSKQ